MKNTNKYLFKFNLILLTIVFYAISPSIAASKNASYSVVNKIQYLSLEKGYAKVVIPLSKSSEIKHKVLYNPYLVYVDIKNSRLGKSVKKINKNVSLPITQIRAAQNKRHTARVVIEMEDKAEYVVLKEETPPRVLVYVKKKAKGKFNIPTSKKGVNEIILEAKKALKNSKYHKAIQLYTKILDLPENKYSREAQESLGIAREMNGQTAHARGAYKRYLKVYPKGKGAVRVIRRLKKLNSSSNSIEIMIANANKALKSGKYQNAIRLYNKILYHKSNNYMQKAQEFIGLSYEKNNQIAHAIATYKEYLESYPKGEGTARVRQRLAGIETATSRPRKKLRKIKKRLSRAQTYGSFSQFYNRDDSFDDTQGLINNISSLSTDLNLNYRNRTEKYDIKSVYVGGYNRDFLDGDDSDTRLSRLYLDILHKPKKISMRIGRQQNNGGGVIDRFDGGNFSYRLNEYVKPNFVVGIPIQTTKLVSYRTDKYLYGINVDIGTLADVWDFNAFFINQVFGGLTDRRAVGGEVSFLYNRQLVFSYFDYDILFNELNTVLFSGSVTLPTKDKLNFTFDYRKNPILSLGNAMIGQEVTSPTHLLSNYSLDEIKNLARDRTSVSKLFLIGFTHPVNEKLEISGDLTISNTSSTSKSGGVEALPSSGNEYFYNLQAINNNLFIENDIAIVGLRYSDASTSDTVSLVVNTRFPYTRNFRINPRFRVDYRKRSRDEQFKFKPTIRLDYHLMKIGWLELDSDFEWDKNLTDETDSTLIFSFSLGYRIDF